MLDVAYRQGDITLFSADAIITPINSKGMWVGGVDRAIKKVAGDQYHQQALAILQSIGLKNKDIVCAQQKAKHGGKFKDVIFVVDERTSPLNEIILKGLRAARAHGYKQVTMPLMRTGVMAGVVEPDIQAVIKQMDIAFGAITSEVDMSLTLVIYDVDTFNHITNKKMGM